MSHRTIPFPVLAVAVLGSVAIRAQQPPPQTPPKPAGLVLPEGTGRDLVQRVCGECHPLERILGTRENFDGWVRIVNDMATRGAAATDDEFDKIVAYLVEHFGRPARPVRPNFAGRWTAVQARGGAPGQTLIVTQTATALTVTQSGRDVSYPLDGSDPAVKVTWEAGKLVLTTTSQSSGKAVETVTTWSLDADGSLVVERTSGQETNKTIYKKQ